MCERIKYEFKRIRFKDLNARQKENFYFQKVASTLADYGFNCIPKRFNVFGVWPFTKMISR